MADFAHANENGLRNIVQEAEELNARVVRVPIRGYGAALAAGIEAARAAGVKCVQNDCILRQHGARPELHGAK